MNKIVVIFYEHLLSNKLNSVGEGGSCRWKKRGCLKSFKYLNFYCVTGFDGIQAFLSSILLVFFRAFPGHGSDFCERLIDDVGCLFSNTTLWALIFAGFAELDLLPLGGRLCPSVVLRRLVPLLPLLPDGKIWSLPFLGLRPTPSTLAQSKERKGPNFAICSYDTGPSSF